MHIFCVDFETRLTKLSSDVEFFKKDSQEKFKGIDTQVKLILFLLGICLSITFTDTVANFLR